MPTTIVNLNDLHAIWLPHSLSVILILYIRGELELRVFKEKIKVQATSMKLSHHLKIILR